MVSGARRRRTRPSGKCTKHGALLVTSPTRPTRPAGRALLVRTLLVGAKRAARRGHAGVGQVGHQRHARRRSSEPVVGRRRRRSRRRPAPYRDAETARTRPAGPRDTNHGHPAVHRRRRSSNGSAARGTGHERRAYQLRSRQCRGVALDGTKRTRGRGGHWAELPRRDGPRGSQDSNRTAGAWAAMHQTPTTQERARPGDHPGAGLAYGIGAPGRPTRSGNVVDQGFRQVAWPPIQRRRPRTARHSWLETSVGAEERSSNTR